MYFTCYCEVILFLLHCPLYAHHESHLLIFNLVFLIGYRFLIQFFSNQVIYNLIGFESIQYIKSLNFLFIIKIFWIRVVGDVIFIFQTSDVLLDYLLVFLPSYFSRFFIISFLVFFFVVGSTYLFYLQAFNLSFLYSYISLFSRAGGLLLPSYPLWV